MSLLQRRQAEVLRWRRQQAERSACVIRLEDPTATVTLQPDVAPALREALRVAGFRYMPGQGWRGDLMRVPECIRALGCPST